MKTHIYNIYKLHWKHSWREVYSDTDFFQETRKISNNLTYYLKELDKKKKRKKEKSAEGSNNKDQRGNKDFFRGGKKSIKPRTGFLKEQRKLTYLWPSSPRTKQREPK